MEGGRERVKTEKEKEREERDERDGDMYVAAAYNDCRHYY